MKTNERKAEMNNQHNDPPVATLRDGMLKASIWENYGERGVFFATTFAKTYEDENGDLKDGHSFTGTDLLRLAELARQAYAKTGELRVELGNRPENDPDYELTAQYQEHSM
jgi:hypothetical protein